MEKVHTLLIGLNKFNQLKEGKCDKVSHKYSKAWKLLYEKKPKKVRFIEPKFGDEIIFVVKSIQLIQSTEELTISIVVKQIQ